MHDIEQEVAAVKKWTARNHYMVTGVIFVMLLQFITDPDLFPANSLPFGGSTLGMLILLSKVILGVTLLHVSRKALIDYVDFKSVYLKCKETPEGSGLFAIAVGLITIALAILISTKL
jgi:hypothetical protein